MKPILLLPHSVQDSFTMCKEVIVHYVAVQWFQLNQQQATSAGFSDSCERCVHECVDCTELIRGRKTDQFFLLYFVQ